MSAAYRHCVNGLLTSIVWTLTGRLYDVYITDIVYLLDVLVVIVYICHSAIVGIIYYCTRIGGGDFGVFGAPKHGYLDTISYGLTNPPLGHHWNSSNWNGPFQWSPVGQMTKKFLNPVDASFISWSNISWCWRSWLYYDGVSTCVWNKKQFYLHDKNTSTIN